MDGNFAHSEWTEINSDRVTAWTVKFPVDEAEYRVMNFNKPSDVGGYKTIIHYREVVGTNPKDGIEIVKLTEVKPGEVEKMLGYSF